MAVSDEEKEKSINNLITAIDKAYHRPGQLAWRSFTSGLMSGLGATIGVAIVVAVLGILVRQFGGVPVIGQIFQDLGKVLSNAHR